jgi:hypothetical protein
MENLCVPKEAISFSDVWLKNQEFPEEFKMRYIGRVTQPNSFKITDK